MTDELSGDQAGAKLTEDTGKTCTSDKDSPEQKIQKHEEKPEKTLALKEPPTNELKTPDRGQKMDKKKDGETSDSVKTKDAVKEADNTVPDSPGSLGTTLVLSPVPRKRTCAAPTAASQTAEDTTKNKEPKTSKAKAVPKPKVCKPKASAVAKTKTNPKASKSPAKK